MAAIALPEPSPPHAVVRYALPDSTRHTLSLAQARWAVSINIEAVVTAVNYVPPGQGDTEFVVIAAGTNRSFPLSRPGKTNDGGTLKVQAVTPGGSAFAVISLMADSP